jgi:MFS family permease
MSFLRSGRAFRLVPAWIAVNGVLGIWLSHAAFQLKRPDDPTQLLVGGYSASEVSRFSAATLALFVVGIGVWGFVMGRYGSLRVMSGSLVGLVALCPALFLLNHATVGNQYEIGGWLLASAASLFIASGFTPAALAYLSRIAEEHASERGAIMGVYSVLLGVGQAMGGAIGAIAAEWRGADGMIGLSAVFAAAAVVAVGALARLDRAAGERQTPQRVDELASLR